MAGLCKFQLTIGKVFPVGIDFSYLRQHFLIAQIGLSDIGCCLKLVASGQSDVRITSICQRQYFLFQLLCLLLGARWTHKHDQPSAIEIHDKASCISGKTISQRRHLCFQIVIRCITAIIKNPHLMEGVDIHPKYFCQPVHFHRLILQNCPHQFMNGNIIVFFTPDIDANTGGFFNFIK